MKTLMTYRPFDRFIFRTPLFSFEYLQKEDELMNNNAFAEALFIASPELSNEVLKLREMPEIPQKEKERITGSLYRYYQRSCTRPTPFGLFAGCSVGIVGDRTEIQLSEQQNYKRTTRLDMNYICALTQKIERDKNIREQLHYYTNNSLYLVGKHYRYVEYHYKKTRRIHQITQVENSEYLEKILEAARTGAHFTHLATLLIDDETTMDETTAFIHELIDVQVLVSELEPAVTNIQPLTMLIEKLNRLPSPNRQIIDLLSQIEAQIVNIDSHSIGSSSDIYPAIIKNVEKTKVSTEIKYLFQTDMLKPTHQATVSWNTIRDIQHALIFLNKISIPVSQTNISQFKENYTKRYDDKEMPLLFVLDNELCIGYAGNSSGDISPLVDDLVLQHRISQTDNAKNPIQVVLLKKFHQQSFQKEIELTDEDVKGIEAVWDDLPPTFSVMCRILQDDAQGRSVFIQSTGGKSATNLIGRFCHLDKQILNQTLAITEKEAQLNPDVIFAEIVHLPESRIGNILLRPVLRQYEITYLAKSGVSAEFEIRTDDLYISIKNNRIVLRSKRLNKEIIPRMSTAHNYSGQNAMPVYQFLCDLQHQNGRSGLGFFWNEEAQKIDYLPRVVYKNFILSQARWNVHGKETKAFAEIKGDDELLLKVKEWKNSRNIPDTVLLADGDNELFIDMKNPLSIRAWLSIVKKRPSFQLEEFLFDPATAVVRGPDGVFTNEFIFAFYKDSSAKK